MILALRKFLYFGFFDNFSLPVLTIEFLDFSFAHNVTKYAMGHDSIPILIGSGCVKALYATNRAERVLSLMSVESVSCQFLRSFD